MLEIVEALLLEYKGAGMTIGSESTLELDGSYGEGGGQILRTALSLSALTGHAVYITNIRAGRTKPGLRPQHVTAVRAVAALCDAELEGDYLDSQTITFIPRTSPQSGTYTFDVTEAARGGSAGSVMLILQAVLLPLALGSGPSRLYLKGGTHVEWSPSALYVEKVFLPTLARMGVRAQLKITQWGFYPRGGGEVTVDIEGDAVLRPLEIGERGDIEAVRGMAYVAELPSHIPQRMTDRAYSLLRKAGMPVHIEPRHVPSSGAGAGLFLWACYAQALAGFTALGRRGLPSEEVAEMAVRDLLAHHRTGAAVEPHLGDQLVLPLALVGGDACLSVSEVTQHLLTNIWVAHQFGFTSVRAEGEIGDPGMIFA